ncbi:MAG: hypothetical protein F2934_00235 [Actinobacteria bacterium]|uniref:Unannotated protein n=1 Tax=freshwater metagenome TaxID=449393 RepID=A0A6J6TSF9_9ZZZZ|nr:hypothetical protein [Actinomycetota bacterium]MTB05541.1 hypothetical protein [Actinomycetota bacterium]
MKLQNVASRVAAVALVLALGAVVSCSAERAGTLPPISVTLQSCEFFGGSGGSVVVTWSGFATKTVSVRVRRASGTLPEGNLLVKELTAESASGTVTVPDTTFGPERFAVYDVLLTSASSSTYRTPQMCTAVGSGGDA